MDTTTMKTRTVFQLITLFIILSWVMIIKILLKAFNYANGIS